MARNYFGTDGVRGIVGESLTPELVERLGRAAALWTGAAKVFVGRDTRSSGVELEEAFARGVISASVPTLMPMYRVEPSNSDGANATCDPSCAAK